MERLLIVDDEPGIRMLLKDYLAAGKEYIRHHLPQQALVSAVLFGAAPLIAGVENLSQIETAQLLDFYAVLPGMILLIPIFLPEQNPDIRDLIRSKDTDSTKRSCDGASDHGFCVDAETGRMQFSSREIPSGSTFRNDFPGRTGGRGLRSERKSGHRLYGISCILSVRFRDRRKISGQLVFVFLVGGRLYRKKVSGCDRPYMPPDGSVGKYS